MSASPHFDIDFLAERDSFSWSTIGSAGWPYVQHRDGPKGFLQLIDDHTLAFANFRGNKRCISTGNLLTDNRVAMILVDYSRQARLKIFARITSSMTTRLSLGWPRFACEDIG